MIRLNRLKNYRALKEGPRDVYSNQLDLVNKQEHKAFIFLFNLARRQEYLNKTKLIERIPATKPHLP